jgi:hypothetical protein
VLVGNIEMDTYFAVQFERIRETCYSKAFVKPLVEGLIPFTHCCPVNELAVKALENKRA